MGEHTDLFLLTDGVPDGDKKLVLSGDRETCMNYVGHIAHEENYNVYRRWQEDDWYFYDCGAKVFCTRLQLEPMP